MKRNWKSRVFAGFLCFVLMFGLIPTGILSELMPEVVPDIAPEAEAANGGSTYLSGLFYVRVNDNRNLYLTDDTWTQDQPIFTSRYTSGEANMELQMWLLITGSDGHLYIRSMHNVMNYKRNDSWGNRWLNWDSSQTGVSYPCTWRIENVVNQGPGVPTGNSGYKWKAHNLTPLDNGAYTCAIRKHEGAAANYLKNTNNTLTIGSGSDTSGTYFYLEPIYDPDVPSDRPLKFTIQPYGGDAFKLNNSSGTTVNMVGESTHTINNTWALTEAEKGYWYIINRSTGNYLTVGTTAGASLSTKTISNSTNPTTDASIQWQLIRQVNNKSFSTYMLINKGSGLILCYNSSSVYCAGFAFDTYFNYITLGYDDDFGSDVPEAPKFYNWTSGTYKYYPANFSNQPGYVALRANYAKSIEGDKEGYLFDTAAMSSLGNNTPSLSSNTDNHFKYNSAFAGIAEWPAAHTLGTTTMYFSFPQSSSSFFWLIGHGTTVTVNYNGTNYSVTDGITKVPLGTSGTGTVSLTASGHFGIFTNVEPSAQTGSVAVTMEGTNNLVIHSDTSYTVRVTNNTSYAIDNVSFTVSVTGGHSVTLTVSNGAGSSSNSNVATISTNTSGRIIGAGKSATWTITMKPGGMTGGTNYTITANTGTYISYKSASAQPNASNTIARGTTYSKALQECNGGKMTASIAISPNGGVVNGDVTYTITINNGCNHTVNNINFTFGNSSVTLFKLVNGAVQNKHAACYDPTGYSNSIGANSKMTITVKVNMAHGGGLSTSVGTAYQFAVSSGTAGNCSYTTLTFSTGNSTNITTVKGNVTIKVTSNVSDKSVVKGNVVYTIEITNGTNHSVNSISFILNAGSTQLLKLNTNGTFTLGTGVTVNIDSVGTLTSGQVLSFTVTVDTTKLSAGTSYTVATASGSAAATGLASGSRSLTITTGNVQTITTANGKVTVGLSSTTVNNNGVGEGNVSYTITLKNETNHALKGINFVLKDSAGNTLLVINADGTVSIKDSAIIKNGGTVSGSLTNLASGATVTVSGIIIDANASKLDATGRLILVATGNSTANGVQGSLGSTLTYSDNSDTFTMMVRHDVDLIVQAGKDTTISAGKIFAAMDKSGAYGTEKGLGLNSTAITAIAITDINGGDKSVSGLSVSGTGLKVNLTADYTEFIVKVTYNGKTVLVPMQISTVDAGSDKTFVLDYGLPTAFPEDLLDDARLTGGSYSAAVNAITGMTIGYGDQAAASVAGTFGNFTYENGKPGYTTTKFLADADNGFVVIMVGNTGTENVDYVNVYKKISVIPSNVIYYEDTLVGSIKYPDGYTLVQMGSLSGTGVSGKQDTPATGLMGHDDGSYANAKDVMLSGESVQKVIINDQQVTVSFTFKGTGFELISRVNAKDAATLLIYVTDPSGATKIYPVITRFDPNGNGNTEVYQVPVFRLNNGAYGDYKVEVKGLPKQDFDQNGNVTKTETSYIYIDGIRVYNPLGNDALTNHYGAEQGAEFTNLRDLILDGKGMVALWNGNITGFTAGSYYYLGNSEAFSAALGSVNELGAIGANNEILVRRSAGNHMVVLKVKDNGGGLLQVGIHDIHDAKFDGTAGDNASSTVSYKTKDSWQTLKSQFYSGTEQYYSIDLNNCPTDGEYKLVILQVDSGFVSFSNIKHKNVTFATTGAEVLDAYTESGYFFNENGDMCQIIYGNDNDSSEDDVVKVVVTAANVISINKLNGILSGNK